MVTIMEEYKKYIAEFIGTFALVFVGAGAAAVSGNIVAVALAHGLILAVMISQFGDISGTHINPAVTIGLLVGKKIDVQDAIFYLIMQLFGGIAAGILLFIVITPTDGFTYGATQLAADVELYQGFLIEMILTFFLASSVYQAAVYQKGGSITPLIIGFTLAAAIMMGGNLTGASLNPARTLGPLISQLLNGTMELTRWINFLIVYCGGTVSGGILAALLHNFYFTPEK